MEIIKQHLPEIILAFMAFMKVIINLFPTDSKGAQIFGIIDNIINALVPDNKAGGGTHKK